MRPTSYLAAASILLVMAPSERVAPALERIAANDNRTSAGTLKDGVLTLRLEAREGEWHPDGESDPGVPVRAFAEAGKRLVVPAPLVRVPTGTEIRATIHNSYQRDTLLLRGLSGHDAMSDTVRIAPGATRELRFTAGAPGTYHYSASVSAATPLERSTRDALLSGAFVVDERGTTGPARDRVFVISAWTRQPRGGFVNREDVLRFAINGKSWPNTERLAYAVGDTVRFRVLNTSIAVHPMHLHGFYFRVDGRGNGIVDSVYDRAASPQMVVTERAAPGRTFAMTWVPVRSGNWLFHCHDNFHVLRNAPLDGTPLPPEQMVHTTNHALEMMGGLVMGIDVRGREATSSSTGARRNLRLVVARDTGGTDAEPSYGYDLQEGAATTARPRLPGPTILLERGKPVSITVVNQLAEPTAVHWHGIELESYFDGVADYSGSARRRAGAIAPRDSFEARFTPPRSGTFMYHPHADETRQQQGGLSGALLVVDSLAAYDAAHDIVLLLSVPRTNAQNTTAILINGSAAPPSLELKAGERYRLRFVDIHTFRPSMIARVFRDSSLVTWRALAKDGMDLPPERSTVRPAIQQMGNGETYDFELAPSAPAALRLTISAAAGPLLAAMEIRVR